MATTNQLTFLTLTQVTQKMYSQFEGKSSRRGRRALIKDVWHKAHVKIPSKRKVEKKRKEHHEKDTAHFQRVQNNRQKLRDDKVCLEVLGLPDLSSLSRFMPAPCVASLNDMVPAIATSETATVVTDAAQILAVGAAKNALGISANIKNLAEIVTKASETTKSMPQVIQGVTEATQSVNGVLDSANVAMKEINDLLSNGASSAQTALSNLLISLPNIANGSILLFCVVESVRFFHNMFPGLMAKVITQLSEFVSSLGDRLKSLQFRETSAVLEDGDTETKSEESAKGFLNGVCSYLCYVLFGSDSNDKGMARQIKHYKEMALSFTSISAATVCATKLLQWLFVDILPKVMQKVYTWFGLKNTNAPITIKGKEMVVDCSDFVLRVYAATEFDPKRFADVKYCQEVVDLYDLSSAICAEIVREKLKFTAGQLSAIMTACRDMRTFFRSNINMLRGVLDVARPTPFAIDFAGRSGAGKSTIMSTLAKWLLHPRVCEKYYDPNIKQVYTMSDTNFMDGYVGQPVTIVDDLYSLKDGSTDPSTNEYLRMLKLKSNVSVYTNQAALEWKGLPYTCDLFMGSTNTPYPEVKSMNNQTAVWRRRNFLWYVIRHEGLFKDQGPFKMFNSIGFVKMDPLDNKEYASVQALETDIKAGREYDEDRVLSFKEMYIGTVKAFNAHLKKPDAEFLGADLTNEQLSEILPHVQRDVSFFSGDIQEILDDIFVRPKPKQPVLECVEPEVLHSSFAPVKCHINEGEVACCMPHYYDADVHYGNFGCTHTMNFFVRYFYNGLMYGRSVRIPHVKWDQFDEEFKVIIKALVGSGCIQFRCGETEDIGKCWDIFVDSHDWTNYECQFDFDEYDDIGYIDNEFPLIQGEDSDYSSGDDNDVVLESLSDYTPSNVYNLLKETFQGNCDFVIDGSIPRSVLIACAAVAVIASMFTAYKVVTAMWNYLKPKPEPEVSKPNVVHCPPDWVESVRREFIDQYQYVLHCVNHSKNLGLSKREAFKKAVNAVFVECDNSVELEASAPHSYDGNKRVRPNKREVRITKADIERIVLEAYIDTENFQSVINTVSKNMFSIEMENTIVVQGLGLYDHKVVLPLHFSLKYAAYIVGGYLKCIIHMNGAKFNTTLNFGNSLKLSEWEQEIVEVGNAMPLFKNIVKHIQTSEEMLRQEGQFLYVTQGRQGLQVRQRVRGTLEESIVVRPSDAEPLNYTIPNHYKLHNLWFGQGYCGSLCFNLANGKIAGFHIAGSASEQFTLMAPMISELYGKQKMFSDPTLEAAIDLVDEKRDPCLIARGSNECMGVVPNEYFQMPPQDTKLKPTIFQSNTLGPLFEVRKEPAVMSLRDHRVNAETVAIGDQPLQKGLDKSNDPAIPFADDALDFAENAIVVYMKQYMQGQVLPRRLLTMHEIINGVVGAPGEGRIYDGMDMKTSPGLPYRSEVLRVAAKNGLSGKMAWFENDLPGPSGENMYKLRMQLDGQPTGSLVMERYNDMKAALKRGDVPFFVAAMNLKIETLKKSKIATADTRVFECFPIHVSMIIREYFGAFIASAQAKCVDCPISVGIAAQNLDWTNLATRLNKFGGEVIAGDYKKWDGKVMPVVLQRCADIVNKWYDDGEENAMARRILLYTHSHAYMACSNGLFRRHSGISSGSPITSPINSLCNWMYIYASIYEICQFKKVTLTNEKLFQNTELAFYGDDHVVAIGPELKGVVTFKDFYNIFTSLGIGYTDSGKSENIDFEYENLQDITYLKRGFVRDGCFWLAPLSIDSIENIPMWYEAKRDMTSCEALEDKKNSYCDELVMHGKETYDTHVNKWNAYLQKLVDQGDLINNSVGDVPFIVDTYEQKRNLMLVARGQM